ncbi:cold-shock protein [Microvirga brassicacearum]|uniref:Cold-shock protein n=1 Tax=Microvirga brassicacearum TaxID=2580413 RepID=A0A5N3PDZ9_9HYPH|nr:cold shock protein [Microvirga brassicacearum]KAB0267865.1 cold-shock protein [Microvirga brassicacearum]
MGRGNSHRERDRSSTRHAEDSWGDAPPSPPPVRPRLPSTSLPEAGAGVTARVKWFNPDKGFGFVALADDLGEAFLPARALEAAGYRSLEPGVTIVARLNPGPKGPQVAAIISVDSNTAAPEPRRLLRPDRPAFLGRERHPQPESSTGAATPDRDGIVKWFDPVRGFGFVTVAGEPKDLFVHVSVLQRTGISAVAPGQPVRVAVMAGRKGNEIGALSLL